MNSRKQSQLVGSLHRKLLVAMVLNSLAIMLGTLVDSIVIGNCLGTVPMAAYGLACPFFVLVAMIGGILMTGIQAGVMQSLGRGHGEEVQEKFSSMVFITLIFSLVIMLLVILFRNELAGLLGAGEELKEDLTQYLLGFCLGLPATWLPMVLGPALQIDNDSQRFIRGILISLVINVGGDLLVAFVLPWGMFGIAIFSTISGFVNLFYQLLHFRKNQGLFRFSMKSVRLGTFFGMLRLGIPGAVKELGNFATQYSINLMLVAFFTTAAVTAYSIGNNVLIFIRCIGEGSGVAVLMLGSFFYGEKDRNSLVDALKAGAKVILCVILPLGAVVFAAAPWVIIAFGGGSDPEVLEQGTKALRYFASALPFIGILELYRDYFQAIGRRPAANALSVIFNILLVPCIAYLGSRSGNLTGIWLSYPLAAGLTLLGLAILILVRSLRLKSFQNGLLFLKEGELDPGLSEEWTAGNLEEVVGISEKVHAFCLANGVEARKALFLSLYVEEMAGNVIQHGYEDHVPHHMDVKCILDKKAGDLILRFRDDCRPFDPREYLALVNPEDPCKGMGIRIVTQSADAIEYQRAVNMNDLIVKVKM